MPDREKIIKALECCIETSDICWDKPTCPYNGLIDKYKGEGCMTLMMRDILSLLKAQEPRVMALSEIKDYLADPDGDKKPLWLEWSTIPALSGWVLASQVSDLMKRYMDSYNTTWRPWTSRPDEKRREETPWE